MPNLSYPVEMISGMPVVTVPAKIDVTTAHQLRTALLEATGRGHATVVVDMARTRFCDSAALGVLIRAHKRALDQGGELRLVIPADGAVQRMVTLASLYRFVPARFGSLHEALRHQPAVTIPPARPAPAARPRSPRRPAGRDAWPRTAAASTLEASAADGESGPVITLRGEADLTSAARLSALVTRQLSGGTRHLTVDAAGLSFADSASVQVLVLAARTLRKRGGVLVLVHPRPTVARSLALTGAEQMFTIREEIPGAPEPTDPPRPA